MHTKQTILPVLFFMPTENSDGDSEDRGILVLAPSGMPKHQAKGIVQNEILRANYEDAENIDNGGACDDGLCVRESIQKALESKGFVFIEPEITDCWDMTLPRRTITTIRRFTYVNQHGGTSQYDASQAGLEEFTVAAIKSWEDDETGWHFVAHPEDEKVIDFLKSVQAPEKFVYFSEFDLVRASRLQSLQNALAS